LTVTPSSLRWATAAWEWIREARPLRGESGAAVDARQASRPHGKGLKMLRLYVSTVPPPGLPWRPRRPPLPGLCPPVRKPGSPDRSGVAGEGYLCRLKLAGTLALVAGLQGMVRGSSGASRRGLGRSGSGGPRPARWPPRLLSDQLLSGHPSGTRAWKVLVSNGLGQGVGSATYRIPDHLSLTARPPRHNPGTENA
jgi:hypothetical protein